MSSILDINTDDNYFDQEDEETEQLYQAESEVKGFLREYSVEENCEINEDCIGITFDWTPEEEEFTCLPVLFVAKADI